MSQLDKMYFYLDIMAPYLRSIQPELQAFIKFYIFKHSVVRNNASIGEEMLELKLFDARSLKNTQSSSSVKSAPSKSQLWSLGLMSIGAPYILERFKHLMDQKTVYRMEIIYKTLNLMNFVIFLMNGNHRSLKERLTGVKCGYSSLASAFNPINYDFMSREVLWFAFAEFASFTLPLFNWIKIKNSVRRFLTSDSSGSRCVPFNDGIRSKSDLFSCAICSESPVNARDIGCNHCFCYYCIMTSILSDPSTGFSCPECNFKISGPEDIREVYLKGF